MDKIKTGAIYAGIVLVWVGGFGLAAYAGGKIGEGIGVICTKATEKMLKAL